MLLGNEVQRASSQTGQTTAGILGETPQEQGTEVTFVHSRPTIQYEKIIFWSSKRCKCITNCTKMRNKSKKCYNESIFFFLQNIFVSYDLEHFEEDEDKAPNGKKRSHKKKN